MSISGSGHFGHDASQVELLPGSLESEFTPQQIANFKQAFGVFDVNRDGRISTQEIFEVLTTMGNEVSAERQAKIKQAVVAVDVDRSGDLDFAEFIQFMKIMDEHNKTEALDRKAQAEQEQMDLRASWKYFSLININIKMHPSQPSSCSLWQVLVALACIYSLGHAIFIGIIIAFGWNPAIHQNPGTDTNDNDAPESNYYAPYVLYARYVNYANAVLVLQLFTDERKLNAVYDVLKDHGYKRSFFNLLKYVLRPIFVLNAAISVVYIGGIVGLQPTTSSIQDNWVSLVFPAAVFVVAYFSLSYFLYFETFVVPANAWNYIKVLLSDIFLFNWIRFVFQLLKNVVAILLLPVALLLTIAMLMGCCCCPHFFDTNAADSKTHKFLKLHAWFMG